VAYEWIYHGDEPLQPAGHPPVALARRLKRLVWPIPLLAAALAAASLYGKMRGVDALTGMEGYRPVFALQRVQDFQAIFFRDVAFLHLDWPGIGIAWIAISYLAWRRTARRVSRFAWAFLLIAPLPIEFLPGKSQACLYLPMIPAALLAAVVTVDLVQAAAGFLAREPLFRRFGEPTLFSALLLLAVFYWGRTNFNRKTREAKPVMAALGRQTAEVIEQFRVLQPRVAPGTQVVFLHDPFEEWDMLFIADLWFRDRSVRVHLQRLAPLPPQDLARATQFDFAEGKLIRIQ
jgi:hypothetical protein